MEEVMFNGHVVIFADGGCLNNGKPDAEAYGSFHIRAMRDEQVLKREYSGRLLYPQYTTNNAAEFQIVLDALDFLLEKASDERISYPVVVYSDSQLVVNAISGEFTVSAPHLVPIFRALQERLQKFDALAVQHVSRAEMVKVLGH
jgi:ribonuclease HI